MDPRTVRQERCEAKGLTHARGGFTACTYATSSMALGLRKWRSGRHYDSGQNTNTLGHKLGFEEKNYSG